MAQLIRGDYVCEDVSILGIQALGDTHSPISRITSLDILGSWVASFLRDKKVMVRLPLGHVAIASRSLPFLKEPMILPPECPRQPQEKAPDLEQSRLI